MHRAPSGPCTAADTGGFQVVVQHRSRLFREGISQLLEAWARFDVMAAVATGAEVLDACSATAPGAAVVEADVLEWDPLRLAGTLRRGRPELGVVGLTTSPATSRELAQARLAGMNGLVAREDGVVGIIDAIRQCRHLSTFSRPRRSDRSGNLAGRPGLTARELEVLSLVGAGLTTGGVSIRLNISQKTVENHKERIFAKLGVQNQAHAVSVAIRTGALPAEPVIDLAMSP